MYNLNILDSLKDKQEVVFNYKECIKDKIDAFKNIKAQPIIYNMYKIIANIMTSSDTNAEIKHSHKTIFE